MIRESKTMEEMALLQTAARMCAAARTAPKAHGKDTIRTLVVTDREKEDLAAEMEALGRELMGEKMPTWYGRDANNVRGAGAVVLVGARREYRGVPHCGYCGFSDCGACQAAGEAVPTPMWTWGSPCPPPSRRPRRREWTAGSCSPWARRRPGCPGPAETCSGWASLSPSPGRTPSLTAIFFTTEERIESHDAETVL